MMPAQMPRSAAEAQASRTYYIKTQASVQLHTGAITGHCSSEPDSDHFSYMHKHAVVQRGLRASCCDLSLECSDALKE